jgi:hypothetical protein
MRLLVSSHPQLPYTLQLLLQLNRHFLIPTRLKLMSRKVVLLENSRTATGHVRLYGPPPARLLCPKLFLLLHITSVQAQDVEILIMLDAWHVTTAIRKNLVSTRRSKGLGPGAGSEMHRRVTAAKRSTRTPLMLTMNLTNSAVKKVSLYTLLHLNCSLPPFLTHTQRVFKVYTKHALPDTEKFRTGALFVVGSGGTVASAEVFGGKCSCCSLQNLRITSSHCFAVR